MRNQPMLLCKCSDCKNNAGSVSTEDSTDSDIDEFEYCSDSSSDSDGKNEE